MSRVYLAGSLSVKSRCRGLLERLVREGYEVTSRWILAETGYDRSEAALRAAARMDYEDLGKAEVLVHCFTEVRSSGGGADAELGIALAREMRIIVLGPKTNIFHRLPDVEQVWSFEELKEALSL